MVLSNGYMTSKSTWIKPHFNSRTTRLSPTTQIVLSKTNEWQGFTGRAFLSRPVFDRDFVSLMGNWATTIDNSTLVEKSLINFYMDKEVSVLLNHKQKGANKKRKELYLAKDTWQAILPGLKPTWVHLSHQHHGWCSQKTKEWQRPSRSWPVNMYQFPKQFLAGWSTLSLMRLLGNGATTIFIVKRFNIKRHVFLALFLDHATTLVATVLEVGLLTCLWLGIQNKYVCTGLFATIFVSHITGSLLTSAIAIIR